MKKSASPLNHRKLAPVFDLGNVMKLDTPTTRNRRLIVAEICRYSGGSLGPMVDYILMGEPGASPQFRLRLMPSHSAKNKVTKKSPGTFSGTRFLGFAMTEPPTVILRLRESRRKRICSE